VANNGKNRIGAVITRAGGILWLAIYVFGLVLTIAWIVLPFALIGTKPLLRELIAEAKKTNALLTQRNSV
jgi:hypothetical protein